MSPSCCGMRSVRRLRIGNIEVGLTGVDSAMELLYLEGWSPDDEDLGKTLLQQLREGGNYIPANEESQYAPVLIELFRKFYLASVASNAQDERGRKS